VINKIVSIPGALIVVVIYFLVSLGFWQIDRADEKRDIERQIFEAQSSKSKLISDPLELIKKEHYNVLVSGHYAADLQFIYDNQIVNSNAGYYVMTPFIMNDRQSILINRGFIPWNGRRDRIADIAIDDQQRTVEVSLIKPVQRPELSKEKTTKKFPMLIQSLNIGQLSSLSKLDLMPIIGRLKKTQRDGFFRQWKPFYGSVDKHLGYALQWFLMALALFIISLRLLLKRSA
jgi:surfeit locus 1 family protein